MVKVRSLVDRDKAMDIHGRTIMGTGRSTVAKTLRKDIPYEEVFTLLRTKLATRERADAMQRNNGTRAVRQTAARVIGESDMDDDDDDTGSVVRKSGSRKQSESATNARSRSPSPATPRGSAQKPVKKGR